MNLPRILPVIGAFALAGCGKTEGFSDLEKFIEDVYNKEHETSLAMAAVKKELFEEIELEEWTEVNKDPFSLTPSAGIGVVNTDCWQPEDLVEGSFLSRYDLVSLKFKGVISDEGQNWALIQAPDASVHRVAVGHVISKNLGRVDSISPQTVSVTEHLSDEDEIGCWQMRNSKLSLNR